MITDYCTLILGENTKKQYFYSRKSEQIQHSHQSITRWNDKIVVLKKTTRQLYFKTFIEKIISGNLIM